jgi:MYXO-CTERM domain-containing protein
MMEPDLGWSGGVGDNPSPGPGAAGVDQNRSMVISRRGVAWIVALGALILAGASLATPASPHLGAGGCDPDDLKECANAANVEQICKPSDCVCHVCLESEKCNEGVCVPSCQSRADCEDDLICSEEGLCVPPRCTSNGDCVSGQVCSAFGTCEAPIDPGPESGCSCRVPGPSPGGPEGVASLLVAAAIAVRTRIRRRSAAPRGGMADRRSPPPRGSRSGGNRRCPSASPCCCTRAAGGLSACGRSSGPRR